MISGPTAVKRSNPSREKRTWAGRSPAGWLEGWTLVIPSVGLAVLAAALAVPRATEPRRVPQPVINARLLDTEVATLSNLADQARVKTLPFSVRELGEAYRRLGRTQFQGTPTLSNAEVQAFRDLVTLTRRSAGDQPIIVLRALQCELLVSAMNQWDQAGKVSDDVIELGGDLVVLAEAQGWRNRDGLDAAAPERWALALKRWTSLAGLLHAQPFKMARELELTQLHFFYVHPNQNDDVFETRQRILKRYADLDTTFPFHYALGVLLAQNGRPQAAATFFDKQLQEHPNGPYALRARNHLLWASQLLGSVIDHDGP